MNIKTLEKVIKMCDQEIKEWQRVRKIALKKLSRIK